MNIPAIFDDSGKFLKNPVFTADGKIYSLASNSSHQPPTGSIVFTWRILDEIIADIQKNPQNWQIDDEDQFVKYLQEIFQEILKTHLLTGMSVAFTKLLTCNCYVILYLLAMSALIVFGSLCIGGLVFMFGWIVPLFAFLLQANKSLIIDLLISWAAIGPVNFLGSCIVLFPLLVLILLSDFVDPKSSVNKKTLSVTDAEVNSAFHKLKGLGIFKGIPLYEPTLNAIIIDETKKLLTGKK